MSFDQIIRANWDAHEVAELQHEANLDARLLDRLDAARKGDREVMESLGVYMPGVPTSTNPWQDLYEDWEAGSDYAHDEDPLDG